MRTTFDKCQFSTCGLQSACPPSISSMWKEARWPDGKCRTLLAGARQWRRGALHSTGLRHRTLTYIFKHNGVHIAGLRRTKDNERKGLQSVRIAYFDPIGGASGDMAAACLIDAGADAQEIAGLLDTLGLPGFSVTAEKTVSWSFACTRFQVKMEHGGHQPRRTLRDITQIIGASGLPERTREHSIRVFHALADAEAHVHATTPEKIHFHEVGAVDSIVDIVAACLGLEMLGVQQVYVGPLPLSHGTVECEHGTIPIPGPAAAELLKDFRWRRVDVEGELVTPTAAALFNALGQDSTDMPMMRNTQTGFGVGQKDYGIPNVLRVMVGDAVADGQ